jgi:hypothetical protein
MKPISVALALIAAASAVGCAQSTTRQSDTSGCSIRELSNRAGWDVPGLSKAKASQTHSRWTTGGLVDVFVDTLGSEAPESSVVLVSCVPGHLERVEVRTQAINVKEILRFSTNGRVFAYRITAQLMGLDETKARVPLASELMLTFYDEDGSGRFTIMQYPGSELIPSLDVPAWTKTSPN